MCVLRVAVSVLTLSCVLPDAHARSVSRPEECSRALSVLLPSLVSFTWVRKEKVNTVLNVHRSHKAY